MGKIEAVILDWAGTTIDFGCFAPVQAFVSAFGEFGMTPTMEEVRKPMGMSKRDHIKTMMNMDRIHNEWIRIFGNDFTEKDIDVVYKKSELSILEALRDYTTPKPYVIDTIDILRKSGIKIGSTTGYTDEMMNIVVERAKENGYSPDCWFSPNSVENFGRPYPYMIFKNLQTLNVSSVKNAIKVGDTMADIEEGLAAGMISVGVIEGSSVMGLSEKEYYTLSDEERRIVCREVKEIFKDCGATHVIKNISELPELISNL